MSSPHYRYPVAVSVVDPEDTREAQAARAYRWLQEQPGGPLVVVTPQRRFSNDFLDRLLRSTAVEHLSWRGLSAGMLEGRRVIYAWPDKAHLDQLWGADIDALVVLQWGDAETQEWVEDANPVRLTRTGVIAPREVEASVELEPLPNGVDGILEHIAQWAAGYSTGLKWNEEDKLKADMMNRPERWAPVTVEQVRAKCRQLGMRPADVETIAGFLQRRKEGRRFNVRGSYKTFHFND